ncbi:hypothetical protein C2E23DRAFT_274609 [Lenzites betulinus]|nr:hypothetical protein C2E23DRAFT_274609 [Lenzites betulinus]
MSGDPYPRGSWFEIPKRLFTHPSHPPPTPIASTHKHHYNPSSPEDILSPIPLYDLAQPRATEFYRAISFDDVPVVSQEPRCADALPESPHPPSRPMLFHSPHTWSPHYYYMHMPRPPYFIHNAIPSSLSVFAFVRAFQITVDHILTTPLPTLIHIIYEDAPRER